ncbi:hypothetical protein FHG66_05965 [Rubellimicrobium rubrum]|uniref:Uncharacterized protein n=1 Tax=Rubellimicrobium rubrum TaxID=2585369 RepID=A0A5C4N030_9RHOB|nr:hypothetical protein [Rubellimicrobium rubrum]TNC51097.1 hypothetical protein FHG66_05965 [Rubellimicrobium rubrum]
MSDSRESYSDRMRAQGKYCLALGFDTMGFGDLDGFMVHGERLGGNLKHVDPTRRHLNRVVIVMGEKATEQTKTLDVAALIQEEAMLAAVRNMNSNTAGLRTNMRKPTKAKAVRRAGPQPPCYRTKTSSGPLREGVLALHRDWFLADEDCPRKDRIRFLNDKGMWVEHDRRKYHLFAEIGTRFLLETFGEAVVFARFDGDEQAGHIHFVLACAVEEKPSHRYAQGRTMFVPSAIPAIRDRTETQVINGKEVEVEITGYENAQNLAGQFFEGPEFAHLNIVRAEPKSALIREAEMMAEGERTRMQDEHEVEPLFADPVPDGAPNAVRQFLLQRAKARQDAEKLISEKKGRTVRSGPAQGWALDYLEALGVITPEDRKVHSTRRAQAEFLATFQSTFGTPEEMMADPDLVADRAVDLARKKIAEVAAQAAEERAREDARAAAVRDADDFLERVAMGTQRTQEGLDARAALEAKLAEEKFLAEADRKAADEAARAERDRLIAEAKEEASGIVGSAKTEAQAIVVEALTEAKSILTRARRKADEWLTMAAEKASHWLNVGAVVKTLAKVTGFGSRPEILEADAAAEALKADPDFQRVRQKDQAR